MSESTVSPLLAVASLAAVFASIVVVMAVDWPRGDLPKRLVAAHAQKAAFAIAAVAMGGSLYYSDVANFWPCEFCWYQRIAMYPLAVLLFVAVVSRQRLPARYPLVVAAIGLALSIYHYQLQLFPEQGTVCTFGVPCTVRYVHEFNLVSIPFMAGCSFFAILVLYLAEWRARYLLGIREAA